MGEEWFYLVLPFIFWCLSRELGLCIGVVLIFNDYTNGLLKGLFHSPRPWDPRIAILQHETSWGFPSGHSQNAVALWGYAALWLRSPAAWLLAVALPLFIGFSRVYLGVHFPHDVVGGWLAGIVVLVLFQAGVKLSRRLRLVPFVVLLIALSVPLTLLVPALNESGTRDMGLLMGVGVGAVLERQFVRYRTQGSPVQQAGRLALGLAVLVVLWLGLRVLLPPSPWFRFLRYAVVALWITLGGPWLFVRLGLARREAG